MGGGVSSGCERVLNKNFRFFFYVLFLHHGRETIIKNRRFPTKTIDSIFAEIRAYRHCYKNAVSFSVMQT